MFKNKTFYTASNLISCIRQKDLVDYSHVTSYFTSGINNPTFNESLPDAAVR